MLSSCLLLTACHTLASTLPVVSSSMKTCGSRTRARMRAMQCCCPLESLSPQSPKSAKMNHKLSQSLLKHPIWRTVSFWVVAFDRWKVDLLLYVIISIVHLLMRVLGFVYGKTKSSYKFLLQFKARARPQQQIYLVVSETGRGTMQQATPSVWRPDRDSFWWKMVLMATANFNLNSYKGQNSLYHTDLVGFNETWSFT